MSTVGRVARVALALALVPHELVHYLTLVRWGDGLRIDLAPPSDETRGVPIARLGGGIDPAVPRVALRLAAVAPTLVWPLVAVAVGLGPSPDGVLALSLTAAAAVWAAPSTGDLSVFLDPDAVRAAGRLDARGPTPRFAGALSALLTVAATVVVAGALLR